MFLSHFKQVLNENIEGDGEGWTIVDVFGGSGLLSHVAKRIKSKARVIYNDFDGYVERIKHIDDINRLRQQLHQVLQGIPKNQALTKTEKETVLKVIQEFDGYKDFYVIGSWLCFSGAQITGIKQLEQGRFYNNIRQSDYSEPEGYLYGIEVIRKDFKYIMEDYHGRANTLFVLDPPYLCTDHAAYVKANKQGTFFGIAEFISLLYLTRPPFILFSSTTKSELIPVVERLLSYEQLEAFKNYEKIEVIARINGSQSYVDNMVFKF